ncbi:hypothetical protein [Bathymodiolus japonicus methanotrophic gill symbiont]|uniref:hypothetical protein n=1 Tax=Bathymodiolus japonicus methanotrophic gill symbiont TaxID=113269 RepID=UPI0021E19339|nr:hypothetical protein [Bathymodiolus japonicus methanotrophic gill symbiont]
MCSVCGGRRAAGASPIRCVGERITATGVPEFREVAWRACVRSRCGRRAFRASPIRCVGERIMATGVPEFREVAWRA